MAVPRRPTPADPPRPTLIDISYRFGPATTPSPRS